MPYGLPSQPAPLPCFVAWTSAGSYYYLVPLMPWLVLFPTQCIITLPTPCPLIHSIPHYLIHLHVHTRSLLATQPALPAVPACLYSFYPMPVYTLPAILDLYPTFLPLPPNPGQHL